MPVRNEDHAACYGILIHSMEIAGQFENWTSPNVPIEGAKIGRTESGWVSHPAP